MDAGDPARSRAKHTADLHRLLGMAVMFQGLASWTPAKLAEHFGVTQRTVFRDIKKLQGIGIPVVFDRAKGSYRIEGQALLQPVQLSAEEALALIVLCEDLVARGQIGLLKPAYDALAKIESQLPPALREDVAKLMDHVVIQLARTGDEDDGAGVDRAIRQAIAQGRALEIEYRSAGKARPEKFLFEPYTLFFGVRAWYVFGRHGKHDSVRSLKLRRILKATLSERAFTQPEDFSIQEHLGNAWVMVRGDKDRAVELELQGPLAETLPETRWHHTQQTERRPDGSATMRFTVSGLDEIVWWVLGLGPNCRVVKPVELARRVRELAEQTAAHYAERA
jgi:predicted DNA-binding transcriptional regulator YafY